MAEHPNLQVARRVIEAFAERDLPAMTELMTDDIKWHIPGSHILSGEYEGREQVLQFLGKIVQETEGTFTTEIHDLFASDDHIVALLRFRAERKGRKLDEPVVQVWHVTPDQKLSEYWAVPVNQTAVNDFWS
jgi:uncharacterized protein